MDELTLSTVFRYANSHIYQQSNASRINFIFIASTDVINMACLYFYDYVSCNGVMVTHKSKTIKIPIN